MQTVHSTLSTRLRNSFTDPAVERKPCDLIEFYESTYIPDPVTGFDPTDAVQNFSTIDITWDGISQRRNVVSRGNIDKHKGEQTNTVSINFSNIDKFMAAWNQTVQIEGMWVVIRYVERDITAGSLVLFVGKAGKPSTINLKSFSISATQETIDINAELPLRTYTAQDPEGRSPSDPLYEGIRLVAVAGSNQYPTIVPARNTLARLIGQRDTVYVTKNWSSLDGTPYGQPIREVLGRAQLALRAFFWADKGLFVAYLMEACAGPIQGIENIKNRTSGFSEPFNLPGPVGPIIHLGDAGGTGTNLGNTNQFQESGKFSHLAYIEGASTGSAADVEDNPPEVTALIIGRRVPTPDNSGVYPSIDVEATLKWSDNPVDLARWIFIVTGVNENFLEDSVNYLTRLHCDEPLLDESNSQRVFIPSGDLPQTGTQIIRYVPTGFISPRSIRYALGDAVLAPWLQEPEEYEPLDLEDIPGTYAIQRVYRKRYTFNAPIVERVKAVDFKNKVLYPAARLFDRMNSKGKIEIHSEKPSDNSLLRSSSIVGATSILVDDVTQWKENLLLQGLVNIGFGLTTSENRRVTSALFSADGNAISLTTGVTGSVTATASGANLTGGSTTVQASGTVTIGGSMSGTVTITINGIAIEYALVSGETTASVAAMLAVAINADTRLNRYIKATSSGAVLKIKAKYGVLNLDSALANAHTGPRANPVAGPTLAQSAGSLGAGVYLVAYAYVTAVGKTLISPTSSITLTANKKIDVTSLGALPAGVTSVNWYVSDPDTDKLLYVGTNNGSAFSITELPSRDNPGVPPYNSTGEESIRIALSFATNTQGATVLAQSGLTRGNIKTDTFNWPLGSEQSSVNQIKGNFRDSKNDFALTPFKVSDPAHIAQVGKTKPLEVDYSGVDNWHQAFRLANSALSKNREGDWFYTLVTGNGEALLLEEGDLITASDDSGELINVVARIESLSISPNWEVTIRKARRYSTEMFSDYVRQHDIPLPSTLRYVQTVDTQFIPLDIPYWRETDPPNVPGIHVAGARSLDAGDHRGFTVYSDATGAYVPLTQKIESHVPIGEALTALDSTTNTHTLDSVSDVRVQITTPGEDNPTYQLESTTEEKLLAGANKFALGINGRWEIGQFQTATLVGGTTDTYDLSVFLRGRHGTEDHVDDHAIADKFVLLTDADGNDTGVTFIPLPLNLLSQTFNLKAVTTNQDVADATAESFTWTGRTLLSLSTINHKGTRDSENNLLTEFYGRTRVGGGFNTNPSGALNEEVEEYRADIRSADGLTSKRIIPVIVGVSQPAMLEGNSVTKFDSITANTLDSGVSSSPITAVSYQQIELAGNRIDGTLASSGGTEAGIGFVPSSFNWRTASHAQILAAAQIYARFVPGGPPAFEVLEYGVSKYTLISPSGENRVTIMFSGTEVRVYRNWVGPTSEPVYISPKVAPFPVKALAYVEGVSTKVRGIVMTTNPFPKTIYSASQQTEDGYTPGDPIVMDIWQENRYGSGTKTRVTL